MRFNAQRGLIIVRTAIVGSHGPVQARLALVSHTMPRSAGVDGVLGLDFMRGQHLTIDFRAGEVLLN